MSDARWNRTQDRGCARTNRATRVIVECDAFSAHGWLLEIRDFSYRVRHLSRKEETALLINPRGLSLGTENIPRWVRFGRTKRNSEEKVP